MILFISPKYGIRSDAVSLIQAARARGIRTETLLNNWRGIENLVGADERVALYGEHPFCEFVAQEMRWNIYQNSLDWIARIPQHFRKRSIRYMTMEEVIDTEATNQSVLEKRILEPADEPCFQTAIYQSRFPRVPNDTPVLVSTDHEWTAKFRFVIVNKKIAARCCYRISNVVNTPTIWNTRFEYGGIDDVTFVENLLEQVNCAPGCVIDVGVIKDAGWAVASTRPIWTAELFGCNPAGFLDGLFAACKRDN